MFGLMRAKKCGLSADEKNFRRLNYCGTCKTIGSVYGQKSRLLLNHDTVFLAEILTALCGEKVETWQTNYQSYNCLSLPKGEMPGSLQFAAATNIILTKFKLADHLLDEKKSRYHIANKAFSAEFKIAETYLRAWNFPLDEVERILQEQEKIELQKKNLEDFANPTAKTTALFFREGAKIIQREELQDKADKFGFAFGKLIYLLDAFEDYEKDLRNKKFNAYQTAFDLSENKLSAPVKRRIKAIINELETEIIECIYQLPMAENQKIIFSSRLHQNLQNKLKTDLPVLKAKKVCVAKPKITFSERWNSAIQTAKTLAKNYSWQMPVVFVFVLMFAFIAPAQSREARSARECFDLGFNLMFLGGLLGSALMTAQPVLSRDAGRLYPEIPTNKPKTNAPPDDKSGWCDWCECDCGECCCEGCGDGCCNGCCDGCDCSCDC